MIEEHVTISEASQNSAERGAVIDATLRLLEGADEPVAVKALLALEKALADNRAVRDAVRRCRILLTGSQPSKPTKAVRDADQLAPLLLELGTASADGSTVLGRDGYLYLTEGSNYVLSRYERAQSASAELAEKWCNLFDARAKRQRDSGRLFIQFIVPENISSLPENLPFDLATPTTVLALIEAHFRKDGWQTKSIPVIDLFRVAGAQCVPRLDSHQSAYGSYVIANSVANIFGCRELYGLPFTKRVVRSGDLANRFFGTPLYEVVAEPDLTQYSLLQRNPEVLEIHQPSGGGHLGIRCVWRNSDAPIKLRAVAFGNSCFERGGFPLLSWWFSRLFEEFHFVWSVTVDDAYAEAVRADLVIGQTMERFLFVAKVPDA